MPEIKNGDLVYIIYDKRRKWVRKAIEDNEFHSDRGYLKFNEIIGRNYGETAFLHPSNHKVAILPALLSDTIYSMKRQSQIIYPEDIGLILTYSGIKSGFKVIEAGTGSGTVTSIMGIFCRPNGHINSFDIRDIAIKQARKNIQMFKADDNCSVELMNICEEDLDLQNIDFVLLDLATTWEAVPKITHTLSSDGRICCFSPTIEQVKKNHRILNENQFFNITTIELIKRSFQVKPNATRPIGRVNGHTGYLTFANRNFDIPLLSNKYFSYYSPENIGYILVHLGCSPGDKILLVCPENGESPLPDLFNKFYGRNIHVIKIPTNPDLKDIEKSLSSLKLEDKKFEGIIIDSIKSNDLVKHLYPFLENGRVLFTLGQFIELAKSYYDQMYILHFYEISTCELIKRRVNIEEELGSFSTVEQLYNPGYLTLGRKVVDNLPNSTQNLNKSKKTEFVETVLDVAVNFPESMPKEEKKIDYANIRD
ncbi:MAG: tRNA (adenine-N1)-methyltransferase [Promethearchaeota archaeon]